MAKRTRSSATPKNHYQSASTKANTKQIAGLVISHLGKALAIESEDGGVVVCHTRRRLEYPAVGDRVLWEPCGDNQGRVEKILPRRSLLSRPGFKGRCRPVAANINQLIIVLATEPECDFLLVDQFMVVCEKLGINAMLLLNKIDLPNQEKLSELVKKLQVYRHLDYQVMHVSARSGDGFDQLNTALKNNISMFAGQSGVGKSSISKVLIPDREFQTRSLSTATRRGTHTTTASTLYHLPQGGDIIDSPGVAIFGFDDISKTNLAYGYREFQSLIGSCRFNDCKHINDKGCRVRVAMENGAIDQHRYHRYLKLFEKLTAN